MGEAGERGGGVVWEGCVPEATTMGICGLSPSDFPPAPPTFLGLPRPPHTTASGSGPLQRTTCRPQRSSTAHAKGIGRSSKRGGSND